MQAPRHTIVDGDKPTPWLPSNFGNRMGMPYTMARVAVKNPSANPACTTMACNSCLLAVIPCESGPHLDLKGGPCDTCRCSLSIISAHCHKQRWLSCRNQPTSHRQRFHHGDGVTALDLSSLYLPMFASPLFSLYSTCSCMCMHANIRCMLSMHIYVGQCCTTHIDMSRQICIIMGY